MLSIGTRRDSVAEIVKSQQRCHAELYETLNAEGVSETFPENLILDASKGFS